MAKPIGKCATCGSELTFRYKPMQEWNVSGLLCGKCYTQKITEHYISPDRRDITKR